MTVEAWVRALLAGFDPAGGEVSVRQTSSDAVIARCGEAVVKLHRPQTDPAALTARLQLASDQRLAAVMVAPLTAKVIPVPPDIDPVRRLASVWPRCEVLHATTQDPELIPWARAGALLAALHRVPIPIGSPLHGGRARLSRAMHRLEEIRSPDLAAAVAAVRAAGVRAAAAAGAACAAGAAETLVHGDWHLGQLARLPGRGEWLLIDIDDLGTGCPASDLGRPAGFWAAGLLDDPAWSSFLAAYREGGGPGVPRIGDPWPALDAHARAAVAVAAVRALIDARGALDLEGTALVEACHRMGTAGP